MEILNKDLLDGYLLEVIKRSVDYNRLVTSYFEILYVSGCRPAELFELANWTMKDNLTLQLQPMKKNNTRLFDISSFNVENLNYLFQSNINTINLSYRYLQRWFNEITRKTFIVDSKSVSLYLFRYNYIYKMNKLCKSLDELTVKTGHNSKQIALQYASKIIIT